MSNHYTFSSRIDESPCFLLNNLSVLSREVLANLVYSDKQSADLSIKQYSASSNTPFLSQY